jgi:iron complex transport system ATP-binding protein
MRQKELAARISYVPQADSRYLPFSVEEFVMTGRYPHLSPFTACSREDREAVREALEMTGMSGFAARSMTGLSGGEKQMVMIAASIAQDAGVMLLDEPAAFLDPGHERRVMDVLGSLNREKETAILMVTHDINSAILSGGRTLVLNDGRVEYSGPSSELAGSGILEKVYGRDFDYMRHPAAGCDIIVPDVTGHDGRT